MFLLSRCPNGFASNASKCFAAVMKLRFSKSHNSHPTLTTQTKQKINSAAF